MTTTKITDTASIPALLAGVEERATCKMGRAATRKRFAVVIAKADAVALRVQPRLILQIEARPGTVELNYLGDEGGGAYSISFNPSEPDIQALSVAQARRDPVGAAIDLFACRPGVARVARRAGRGQCVRRRRRVRQHRGR